MSYCRCNGVDSDVYMYCISGGGYQILLSNELDFPTKSYFFTNLLECFDTLTWLKSKGARVPQHTFDRIITEMWGDFDGVPTKMGEEYEYIMEDFYQFIMYTPVSTVYKWFVEHLGFDPDKHDYVGG